MPTASLVLGVSRSRYRRRKCFQQQARQAATQGRNLCSNKMQEVEAEEALYDGRLEVRPDPPASPPSKLRVKAPARKSKTTSALSAPEDDMPKRKTSVRSAEDRLEPVSVKMAVVQHKGSEKGSADSVGLPGQLPEALADMKSDEEDTNFDAVVPARNALSPQQDRNAPVKLSRDEKAARSL
eukprot:s1045_g11.t1